MIKKLLFFGILCYTLQSFSQNNYSKGYIVTANNDTIVADIKIMMNGAMNQRVEFIDTFGNKNIFYPELVYMYKVGDDCYYTKKSPKYQHFYFFKLKIDGAIKVYEYTSPTENIQDAIIRTSTMNSVMGASMPVSVGNQNTLTLVEKGDFFKTVESMKFKKLMKELISDDPDLYQKVVDKTYEESELYIVIRKYNENYKKRLSQNL